MNDRALRRDHRRRHHPGPTAARRQRPPQRLPHHRRERDHGHPLARLRSRRPPRAPRPHRHRPGPPGESAGPRRGPQCHRPHDGPARRSAVCRISSRPPKAPPAMVHCGPFANIAHGTSSVDLAANGAPPGRLRRQRNRLRLRPRLREIHGPGPPALAASSRPRRSSSPPFKVCKQQGEGDLDARLRPTSNDTSASSAVSVCPPSSPSTVFPRTRKSELDTLRTFCEARGAAFALSEAYAKGGAGAEALARKVVEVIAANPAPELTTTYAPTDSVEEKITKVARQIYGASGRRAE